jgi:S1-C subfamily serine protease
MHKGLLVVFGNKNCPLEVMALKVLAALLTVAMLAGCASATRVLTNEKQSEAVKGKSFKAYHEVLFVPPKADPRNVVPRIVQELTAMGFQVQKMDPNKPLEGPQGTGFVIGSGGWVLTCAHVVGEQKEATVTVEGKRLVADVVKSDSKADLALLKLRETLPADVTPLAFRPASKAAAMGEDVFTIGYPLSRILGNNARMTKGMLSATTGIRDDADQVQVSAEIQPGNSGGPLLDHDGMVIGVVNKTLNPAAVAKSSGALPQNVNFAIKGTPVLDFVKAADPVVFQQLAYSQKTSFEDATKAVVKIQAGIVTPDSERADKMVVRLEYVSIWDIWYRFRLFALTAFDYETQEPLFVAGQGRDNVISNEDVVIRDTLEKFRKQIASR